MNLDQVIAQIRTYCAPLGGRVGGAADFSTGTEFVIAFRDPTSQQLLYPAAVVLPLEDDAEGNAEVVGLVQNVTERIAVIVEFDASADRRGQAGVDQVQAMKYALHSALLNWHIDPSRSGFGLYYSGGQILSFDRQRVFWQFVYSLDIVLSDGDGFQISGDPLTSIQAELIVGPTNTPIITEELLHPATT